MLTDCVKNNCLFQIGRNEDDIHKLSGHAYPFVLGHEIAGLVHAMGQDALAAAHCTIGGRVTVYPWIGCDDCPICATGEGMYCPKKSRDIGLAIDGGFAEYVIVPHYKFVVNLPDNIPYSVGSLLPCSGITAFASLTKCSQTLERMRRRGGIVCVAVVGLGGLGQWALKLLPYCLGKDIRVVGIDVNTKKLKAVKESGLVNDIFAVSREETVEEQVKSYDKSMLERPHAIIDFANTTQSFSLCIQLLVRTSIHVMVGLHGGLGELKLPLATLSGATHMGNVVGSLEELKELVEMVGRENIDYPLIKEYSLEQTQQALLDLESGQVDGRAVLTMQ